MSPEVFSDRTKRFKGGCVYFAFGSKATARLIPMTASCYTCHSQHGAVDTTFVRFYPTPIGIAQAKKTLAASFLAEQKR